MTEKDEWRPVVGWEGRYEVSLRGRVRSLDYEMPNPLTGDVSVHRGKDIPSRVSRGGYPQVNLYRPGYRRTRPVHRLVAEAFIPNPDNLPLVLHGPLGSLDNSISNLRWGTNSDNMKDRVRDGTCHASNKTHCPQGHEYTPENTRVESRGSGRTHRRCKTCRSEQDRNLRKDRKKTGIPPDDSRHGTRNGYNAYGCRCDGCRAANSEFNRKRKEKYQEEEVA